MFDLTEDVTYVGEYGLLASLALRAGTIYDKVPCFGYFYIVSGF